MYNLLGDPAVELERPRDEARLALDGDRWRRGVLVDLGQPGFEGNVTVDWLDQAGAKLASATYRANDARFRLVPPANAAAVRVYAASPASGRDAVGSLSLDAADADSTPAKALLARLMHWWTDDYVPRARHPDTITIAEFEPLSEAAAGSGATSASAAR
jgi:hypothetical protein